jgi:hypothetical protein
MTARMGVLSMANAFATRTTRGDFGIMHPIAVDANQGSRLMNLVFAVWIPIVQTTVSTTKIPGIAHAESTYLGALWRQAATREKIVRSAMITGVGSIAIVSMDAPRMEPAIQKDAAVIMELDQQVTSITPQRMALPTFPTALSAKRDGLAKIANYQRTVRVTDSS